MSFPFFCNEENTNFILNIEDTKDETLWMSKIPVKKPHFRMKPKSTVGQNLENENWMKLETNLQPGLVYQH